MRLPLAAGLVLATVVLAGCAHENEQAPERRVALSENAFRPMELAVEANTTLAFLNSDEETHTVTIRDPYGKTVKDVEVATGEDTTYAFPVEGTYAVFCRSHGEPGEGMHMTVHVA